MNCGGMLPALLHCLLWLRSAFGAISSHAARLQGRCACTFSPDKKWPTFAGRSVLCPCCRTPHVELPNSVQPAGGHSSRSLLRAALRTAHFARRLAAGRSRLVSRLHSVFLL